jgi:heptosyltransferase II
LKTKKNIVFIQTAFIGDLFLSLPTLAKLRNIYPDHQLILICKKGLSEYFVKEQKVDVSFEVEKGNSKSYKRVLSELKNFEISAVFCPHRSFRSGWLAFQINAEFKFGFKTWFSFLFFNKTTTYQKSWPDVIRQLHLLSCVDSELKTEIEKNDWMYLNQKKSDGTFPEIPKQFSFEVTNRAMGTAVAIFPGSVWKTKQWTTVGFSEVTRSLLEKNKIVYLMGGTSEKIICDQIQHDCPSVINLAGELSLYESILHLKKCGLVICNDSAPAHMAASLGLKVISIFGPTTVDLGFRPWQNESVVIENENLNCRPCGAHGHHQCPQGHHRCMKDLKSTDVINAIPNNP